MQKRMPGLWLDGLPAIEPRHALDGPAEADVVIVGAGFTGLWTAYYLRKLDPGRSVIVLEAETAGFGASGRNGGWCSAELPSGLTGLARRHGRQAAVDLQLAAVDTLDEVARVTREEGIDCGLSRGGVRVLARTPAQLDRLRRAKAVRERFGFGDDHFRLLDAARTAEHLDAAGVLGSAYSPHCAVLDPARLARGLAEAAERHGAVLRERTRVERILPGLVRTGRGDVRAGVVVRATEGFTASLPGAGRALAPFYSYMIATAPLPESFWRQAGWRDRAAVADLCAHFTYLQRTADDRIALGGRGVGYPWRSRVSPAREQAPAVWRRLTETLLTLFPGLPGPLITHRWGGPLITHRWGGPLAATFDFTPYVGFDRDEGLAWAGGYGGDGVALTNLAGRTLAQLIAGIDGPETRLCWVGARPRHWPPEPLRWLGINAGSALAHTADRYEERTGRRLPVVGGLLESLLG
ncbi:FAD-dependent oxidoreductase [Nonomuraea sp. NN258]|uniref:NAD(P)/FAD-dependent oxidoreductase n=1 Tax=Nonomuraea antri TaxID=2730852 RepID=UPI001569B168|nr:FAD-dependent oxidoreductase [Nonomuraea antri]NRQ33747.1 FAD-dependent oxidoreductase [Nonomuraea antri]